ncbi:MAG: acetylxylan esterase [Proteobacteria bacterium]|nr:acetylxylan esterase [Pseudomonadota bacterium]
MSEVLPDPLAGAGRAAWEGRIRPALIAEYARTMYGPVPSDARVAARIAGRHPSPLGPRIERLDVAICVETGAFRHDVAVALYMPPPAGRPPGLFLGPNYAGNASIDPDPAIPLGPGWMRDEPGWGIVANRATGATRGVHAGRWPLATILARGHAVATWHDGDICPDDPERCRPMHAAGFGGNIAAWAWGVSRVLDGLLALGLVDPARIATIGHSRHGKAALWAGANDARLGVVIANNSGTGGAKIFRRLSGETIGDLFARFPHWFAEPLSTYAGRERDLPFDQHLLIGLCAPRAVYVASAGDDAWADPAGEFAGACGAAPIYALYGRGVPSPGATPVPDGPSSGDAVGYHLRAGGHGVTAHDWTHYLDFAERIFKRG